MISQYIIPLPKPGSLSQIRDNFCAVDQGHGVLEYWNTGILGLVECDRFKIRGTAVRIKSD